MRGKDAKPSAADKAAASKLRAAWDSARKERRDLTQEKAAVVLGITQPAVSQYLRGKIPLGFDALMNWSALLGINARDIRDDLPEQRHLPDAIAVNPIQQRNHILALQLTMRSLVWAMTKTIPGAAEPFAKHLADQAAELDFSDQSGLIAQVSNIAVPSRQNEAASGRPRKRQAPAA